MFEHTVFLPFCMWERRMTMQFDIWKPLYVDKFDCEKYLYHYTSVATVLKIIQTNTLLFSKICETNDTTEAKMRLLFENENVSDVDSYKKKVDMISTYFKNYKKYVQLMCFSTDMKVKVNDRKKYLNIMDKKDIYFDVSGRGFALPRMWAQYSNNNQGVCLVFNKKKLIDLINRKVSFSKHDKVQYTNFCDRYLIKKDRMDDLYEKILMLSNGRLTMLNMIERDKEFLKYNFFEKHNDWSSEHEFRIITLVDNEENDRVAISQISSCLEGVVLGEKINSTYEEIIKLLLKQLKNDCEVRKIQFGDQICKLD